jgi:hypothetical protein
MRNLLVHPPFAEHPPFRVRFDGPSTGLMFAGWGLFGLISSSVTLGQLSYFFAQTRWSALGTGLGVETTAAAVALVVGAVMTVVGGSLM